MSENRSSPNSSAVESTWLLLIHQLPAEPSRVRVKIWRRLQAVGAVALKNSVYVLPETRETREDFEWIRSEIISEGGEAIVISGKAADELAVAEIRNSYMETRQREWRELLQSCEAILATFSIPDSVAAEDSSELSRQLRGLRSRASQIDRIDHLRAPGRREALLALDKIERLAETGWIPEGGEAGKRGLGPYQGRIWLTRPRPGIDRVASAWLIRRFIDPQARFQFADRIPREGEVIPFDMFGVEFSHRGDRVTFEILLEEFGIDDPALGVIARIVHDLDLRVETPRDTETATFGRLILGLRASFEDDNQLLEQGMALFEAFYASR